MVAAQVLGGGAGIVLGNYAGINLLLPLAATSLVWLLLTKIVKPHEPRYVGAISIQAGHLLWIALGTVLAGGPATNWIDVIVLSAGLAWLSVRPGLGPIVLLTVFQLFALVVNLNLLLQHSMGTPAHQALVVHVVWRLLALGAMWFAWYKLRTRPRDA